VLREVEDAQPTVVLKATDGQGRDLSDVTVLANGEQVAASLDGRAIPVDPGRQIFTFEHPPVGPARVEVVIGESEKRRVITAVLGIARAPEPASSHAGAEESTGPKRRTPIGWVLPGALVAAGGAAFVGAGVRRINLGREADDLRSSCGLSCSTNDRDRLSSELATTNVLVGIGIGTLALAAVTWFALGPR
jgi:hypothetical protein